jgi:hypothetical protein
VARAGGTPHAFHIMAPYRTVHSDGSPVRRHPLGLEGLSEAVVWSPLRLNHYVVKSREEFLTRKLPRGRAMAAGLREPGFFDAHDANDATEPMDPARIGATRAELARLALRLAARGFPADRLPAGLEAAAQA